VRQTFRFPECCVIGEDRRHEAFGPGEKLHFRSFASGSLEPIKRLANIYIAPAHSLHVAFSAFDPRRSVQIFSNGNVIAEVLPGVT
jgi:hypothetical protein